ncbi:MAG: hypothetical protein ACRCU2_23005 [Planktothrix sp.]
MKTIFYPTIDAFIYQITEGLGDDPQEEGEANILAFVNLFPDSEQEKIREAITEKKSLTAQSGGFRQLLSRDSHYLDLPYSHIPKSPQVPEDKSGDSKNLEQLEEKFYNLQGYYYPMISPDTLGLLFDCSVYRFDKAQPIESFQRLKSLVPQSDSALGKSWILSGYSQARNQLGELAEEIYKEFRKSEDVKGGEPKLEWEWKNHLHGKFLGHNIFWIPPYLIADSIPGNSGVLIVIYNPETIPDPVIQRESSNLNRDWMNLFGFQNKIIWAYQQANDIKDQLYEQFIEIRRTILEIKSTEQNKNEIDIENLQLIFKSRVKTLSDYAINLCYLEVQIYTIETNLHNYELCLKNIENKSQIIGETSLSCFKDFIDVVNHQYKRQVEKDYASLKPGMTALENLLDTIKNIVELEKGERDRNIENLIGATGIGLGTASAAASSIANFIGEIRSQPDGTQPGGWEKFSFAFFFSIGIGVLFFVASWKIIKILRSRP